jgi:hypothetical protein
MALKAGENVSRISTSLGQNPDQSGVLSFHLDKRNCLIESFLLKVQ